MSVYHFSARAGLKPANHTTAKHSNHLTIVPLNLKAYSEGQRKNIVVRSNQRCCKGSPDTWSSYIFKCFYSPRAGADNPLETNVDVNRKLLSLCPFVASFKTISLKYDFKHILNDFIQVYSPAARAENPLGTNFWSQQKALITSTIWCKFQTNLFEFWFYTHF